ncbi:MAG: tetratricopeptide repeat protein [Methylococcaceae bacterium]
MKKPLPRTITKKPMGAQPSANEINRLVELFNQQKNDELEKSARALLVKFPKNGFIWKILGAVLQRLDSLDESLEAKKKSAELLPNDAEASYNLGNALNTSGQYNEAEKSYRRALKIDAKCKKANYNLAIVLTKLERLTEAQVHYRQEIAVNPTFAEAHSNLGNLLKNLGQLKEAEDFYRQALAVNPSYVDAYTNLLYTLAHNPDAPPEFAFQEALNFGKVAMQNVLPLIHSTANRDANKKLRVGMLSGDFWNHAVAFFMEPLLAKLDKNNFEWVAYYNNTKNDMITQKIKSHFTLWNDIAHLHDTQVAQKIANDQIDIIIDLSGHTDKNRLMALAYKPAPIQVSWLGYPATTGVPTIDYYLVDNDWCPAGLLDNYFVEKLVQLPSVVTFESPDKNVPIVDTPALKNGHITFGSFNRSSKLTQCTLDLWCKTLHAVPQAKMVLGNISDAPLQTQLEKEFTRRGIALNRLTFYAKKSIPEYLALHGEIDFILDTFPYAGGTTTGFALWMGVPVLTYSWPSLAGRGGVLMLSRVQLQDKFVANNEQEFINLAKSWSENIHELQIIRHQLRSRMQHSTKCDPQNVARGLEKGLTMMWERFCSGLPVESFSVSKEVD